jgi:hypothetical protein
MISIIICNKKSVLDPALEKNINSSIGVDYEIISIDNSRGQYNIFQAYNEGVAKAKGDILCFMHDDILFRSNSWGKVVEESFSSDPRMGALGVAGGHFLPDCPCSWSTCKTTSFHVWQTNRDGSATEYGCTDYSNGKRLVEVACLDGLFMCIRQSLFDTIRFDDQSFSGFHCYDSDICMQVMAAGYSVNVTFNIDIEHHSNGACNQQYYDNLELWHKKWHSHLPVARGIQLSDNEKKMHQEYAIELVERGKETLSLYQKLSDSDFQLGHLLLKPYRFIKRKLQ